MTRMKFYLIELVFMLLLSSFTLQSNDNSKNQQLIQIDNDYIRTNYLNNIKLEDTFKLNDQKNNLEQVQSLLNENIYKKSIELTGLNHLFKKLNATSFEDFIKINQKITGYNSTIQNIQNVNTLAELFFPLNDLSNTRQSIESLINLKTSRFQLEFLNLTQNGLDEEYLDTYGLKSPFSSLAQTNLFPHIISSYFSQLKVLQLSHNQLRHLNRSHFEMFSGTNQSSQLEIILLNSNRLTFIRHDTFYDFQYLKYIDLSNNRLKLVHPLTFSFASSIHIELINLSNNRLKAVFNTPFYQNSSLSTKRSLPNLKYLFLNGNTDINCDCGLLWLYRLRNEIIIDDFKCQSNDTNYIFAKIENEAILTQQCEMPKMYIDTRNFDESSEISLFRSLAKRWFAWTVWFDVLPVTTPMPYLMDDPNDAENFDSLVKNNNEVELVNKLNYIEKHVFHVWRGSDAVFKCHTKKSLDDLDSSKSTIVWKTQYGYLSHLDDEIIDQFDDEDDENDKSKSFNKIKYYSYKLFYKMNTLTKIHKNITVSISQRLGGKSISNFYVNENNELVVTQMRQIVAGPFVCISINERGINMYEYDMHIRSGVGEFFVYSLFISLFSMIIPSIIGIIICCICEYQADKNYPMTPPCYPTPQAQTPPNFDFNEWMANAASYLPNINIHDTLEQVSKKLRKGMEKASVTVKSLGLTSTAYIYSMYEQSTNRWNDIKNYVPSLNVPTLTLPTMKYPPVGQLANRMRMGMGNMFIQLKEFCGTSDLIHSASIVDIDIDTNASNAVGKTYIMDQFSNKSGDGGGSAHGSIAASHHNYLRFLNLLREESRKQKYMAGSLAETPTSTITTLTSFQMNENMPTTSALASVTDSLAHSVSSSEVNSSNVNKQIPMLLVKIVKQDMPNCNKNEESDQDSSDEDSENESSDNRNQSNQSIKSTNSSNNNNNNNDDDDDIEKRTSKLEPFNSQNIAKKSSDKNK
jgi:hypothetical protein